MKLDSYGQFVIMNRDVRKDGFEFIEAVGVQPLAVGRDREQCDTDLGSTGGDIVAGRIGFQLSGLSWWKSTARAGTTVEIACL